MENTYFYVFQTLKYLDKKRTTWIFCRNEKRSVLKNMWIINDKFENKQNNFLKLEKKERNGSFTNDEKLK